MRLDSHVSSEMATKDIEKQRLYRRRWYEKNKQRQAKYKAGRDAEIRGWVRDLKSQGCIRCPENDPACIDFHHRDPSEKDFTISQALAYGWSIERIKSEVAKCDRLCANCHRKLHRDEKSGGLR